MTTAGVQRCSSGAGVLSDERAWNYATVECGMCGAVVQVAKFSLQHTSVQWTAEAVLTCAEFSASVAAGGASPLIAPRASPPATLHPAPPPPPPHVLPPQSH